MYARVDGIRTLFSHFMEAVMKTLLALVATLFLAVPAFAAEHSLENRVKFDKACKAMIAKGAPCARVKQGVGSRRHCVEENITNSRVTPECREVINEWKTIRKN